LAFRQPIVAGATMGVTGGERRKGSGAGRSGGRVDGRAALRAGTTIGKYRIESVIGSGGMGTVYRAKHMDLSAPFAVKVLASDIAQNRVAEERFFREAVAASQVRHPHVVRVSDYGRDRDITYFVMDYLEGEDLASLIARTKPSVEQIANIMLPICSAITETHERGFVHRDLKPSNIFLTRDAVGRVVPTLLDFGVAKALDLTPSAALTREGALVGTPPFHAPELLRHQPATARSDQYAVGVILYQCATGELPFDGPTAEVMKAIVAGHFRHPRALRPDLPQDFVSVILRAMNESAADRFASTRALGRALLAFASVRHQAEWSDYFNESRPLGSLTMAIATDVTPEWGTRSAGRRRTVEDEPWPATKKAGSGRKRWPWVAACAGLTCALTGGVLWTVLSHRGQPEVADPESSSLDVTTAPAASRPRVPAALPPIAASSPLGVSASGSPERRADEISSLPAPRKIAAAPPVSRQRPPLLRANDAAGAAIPAVGVRPKGWDYEGAPVAAPPPAEDIPSIDP